MVVIKKLLVIIPLIIFAFAGISCNSYKNNDKSKLEDLKIIIDNYLEALSNKNLDEIHKWVTPEKQETFDKNIINNLEKSLISAELLEASIKESGSERIIVDASVKVICFDDFIATGDWQPGTAISVKSFEFITINGEWKINNWGYN